MWQQRETANVWEGAPEWNLLITQPSLRLCKLAGWRCRRARWRHGSLRPHAVTFSVKQPRVNRRTTNNNGGLPNCVCAELIKASLWKCRFLLLWYVITPPISSPACVLQHFIHCVNARRQRKELSIFSSSLIFSGTCLNMALAVGTFHSGTSSETTYRSGVFFLFVCICTARQNQKTLLMAGRFKVLSISLAFNIETSTRGPLSTGKRNKNRWHHNQSYVFACVSGFYNNKSDGKEAVERAGRRPERQNVPNQFCILPSPLWAKVKVPPSQRRSHRRVLRHLSNCCCWEAHTQIYIV